MGCLGSRQRMASPAASADETATRRSTTPPCSGRSASRRRATRRTRRIMRGRRGGNQSSMGREPIVASCARRVPDHLGEIRVRSDRAAGPAQALGDVPVAARGPRRVARSRRRGTARVARARVLRRGLRHDGPRDRAARRRLAAARGVADAGRLRGGGPLRGAVLGRPAPRPAAGGLCAAAPGVLPPRAPGAVLRRRAPRRV
mmetsp:Transcript_9445/g.29367  ORF Transcript_9445/g.29367 Transcript_9445/m.29367 type:complete len:202 (-) Transcript_9445:90-695(-)